MAGWIAVLFAAFVVSVATEVSAQDSAPGPGSVVVTMIPGGGTFFTEVEASRATSAAA